MASRSQAGSKRSRRSLWRAGIAAVIVAAAAATSAGPAAASSRFTVDSPIFSTEEALDGTSNTLILAEAFHTPGRLEIPNFR
jgi:hypothetical protein